MKFLSWYGARMIPPISFNALDLLKFYPAEYSPLRKKKTKKTQVVKLYNYGRRHMCKVEYSKNYMFLNDQRCIYPTPPRTGFEFWSFFFFDLSKADLNLEFSFSSKLTETKEPNRPYYWLKLCARRIDGFMPFLRIIERSEMQTTSSKI